MPNTTLIITLTITFNGVDKAVQKVVFNLILPPKSRPRRCCICKVKLRPKNRAIVGRYLGSTEIYGVCKSLACIISWSDTFGDSVRLA
jgi:hypothetical protein